MFQFFPKRTHAGGGEHIGGMLRPPPTRQHNQATQSRRDEHVLDRPVVQQKLRQPLVGLQPELLMKVRRAEVGVDQENCLGRLSRQSDGQVDRREGFAFSVFGAGYSQHVPVVFAQSMDHLSSEDFVGIRKLVRVAAGLNAMALQYLVGNVNRTGPRIDHCRWRGGL
ncbi:MAG: hypothetical protein JW395_0271 [Nitrospira sp.]|nr:hypothetical protein [Nitrospira sp.]